MIQTIKIENWFVSEGSSIQNGVQDGRHFQAKFKLIAVDNYFLIVFNSDCIWRILLVYCCFLRFEIFKMKSKMAAITEWGITGFLL